MMWLETLSVSCKPPIMKDQLLGAILHLTIVVNNRNPPLGFKRGQAVEPEDFDSRLTVLNWMVEKYPDSLLHRLYTNINPIATRWIFNQLLDGKRTYLNAMEECCQRARDYGHEPTLLECITSSMLIDDVFKVLDSPFTATMKE